MQSAGLREAVPGYDSSPKRTVRPRAGHFCRFVEECGSFLGRGRKRIQRSVRKRSGRMSKALVAYYTQTGNTLKIAESIYEALPGEKEINSLAEIKSLDGYDLVYIGFPIHNHNIPKKVQDFLKKVQKGQEDSPFFHSRRPHGFAALQGGARARHGPCLRGEAPRHLHVQGQGALQRAGGSGVEAGAQGLGRNGRLGSQSPGCHGSGRGQGLCEVDQG